MSNLIETNAIEGFSIYGVQMVDYTSDGVSGRDFATAAALAAFAMSNAIETEASAYANVLRAREQKLKDLSDAIAIIASVIAKMDPDSPESDDTVEDERLVTAQRLMERYGLSLNVQFHEATYFLGIQITSDYHYIRRDDAENGRANAEYAADVEDNDLQQDMITMQGLISKRDNSFSTAAKILRKVADTGNSIIRSVGQ